MSETRRHRLADALSRWTRPRTRETLPIHIDRSRVYVLPTRFGMFYLLLVATMGIGALNYNNNPALLLGLLLAGAGLASLVAAHLQLSGLNADAIAAQPAHAGQPMPLRLAFSASDTRARDGIRVRIDDTEGTLSLAPGTGGIAELALPTAQRGWLEAERIVAAREEAERREAERLAAERAEAARCRAPMRQARATTTGTAPPAFRAARAASFSESRAKAPAPSAHRSPR